MMHKKLIFKQDMLDAFKKLGMQQGMTVMVHSSLSSLGYVCGGAQTVIRALLETVTREGTIVMATESWKNFDPDADIHNEVGSDEWQAIRDNWPAFEQSPSRSKVRLENTTLRLIRQRELVDFAVEWMEKNRK